MPPWGADETEECQPRHPFKHDPRLTDEQLELFIDWIGDGTPEGDPATAAEIPTPPSTVLADADLRLTTPEIEIEPGKDQFWCFVLDPGFTDTTFIDATQITAGNESIVHHVLIYLDETGTSANQAGDDGRYECFGGPGLAQPTLIGAWAPGAPPSLMPEAVAMNIPVGSKIVVNVHYHPTGVAQVDPGTSLDIRFEKGAPQYFGQLALIGNFGGSLGGGMGLQPGPNDATGNPEFRIPGGVEDHTETMIFRIPPTFPPLKIWSAGTPHALRRHRHDHRPRSRRARTGHRHRSRLPRADAPTTASNGSAAMRMTCRSIRSRPPCLVTICTCAAGSTTA